MSSEPSPKDADLPLSESDLNAVAGGGNYSIFQCAQHKQDKNGHTWTDPTTGITTECPGPYNVGY